MESKQGRKGIMNKDPAVETDDKITVPYQLRKAKLEQQLLWD